MKDYYAIPPSFTRPRYGTVDWSDDRYWQRVYYWQTPGFKRYFAKWYGGLYLLLGIVMPIFLFGFNGINLFTVIHLAIGELMILIGLCYIGLYSFEEIKDFLVKKLKIGVSNEKEKRSFV